MTHTEKKFFIRYLKEKKLYKPYVISTLNFMRRYRSEFNSWDEMSEKITVTELLMYTLSWDESIGGSEVWCKLYNEFKTYYEKNIDTYKNPV